MKGPCGNYNFQGLIQPNANKNGFSVEGNLYDMAIDKQIAFKEFPVFFEIINTIGLILKE